MKKLFEVFLWGTLIGTILFVVMLKNSPSVFIFNVSFVIFTVLFIISIVLVMSRENTRGKFIENYQFPEKLDEKILYIYPYLSKEDLNCVKQELRRFFQITKKCQLETIAMPSRIVDIAWHEFILHTKDYQKFCRRAFGHYLHHNPFSKETTPQSIKNGLQRVWIYSCKAENIKPETPHCLPMLFSIDATLNIPDGNKFKVEGMTQSTKGGKGYLECIHGSYVSLGAVVLAASFTNIVNDGSDVVGCAASDRGGESSGGCGCC